MIRIGKDGDWYGCKEAVGSLALSGLDKSKRVVCATFHSG